MKALSLGIIVVLALSLMGLGVAFGASSNASGAKVGTARTGLGRVIVDSRGRTLYLFEKDKRHKSACAAACAAVWPPLVTKGKPAAIAGAKRSLLGMIRRADGRKQVTYAGHPVYRFVEDTRRGQTHGEGSQEFGGGWDALTPAGKKIESDG
jgi:predicted lipoprotein with Yx(FWY)xxD motif